jgi:hypothetical protein
MSLTRTSIASAMTANATSLAATAATGATVGGVAEIDGEYTIITAISGVNISVRSRGDQGTVAVAHRALAPLTFGLTSDFPAPGSGQTVPRPPSDWELTSVSVSATYDPGTSGGLTILKDQLVVITKATAWLQTITGPSAAQDGQKICFFSATAAAHVITYTAGFHADTTSSDVATFAATYGNQLTIVAQGGKWGIFSNTGVTVA